MTVAATDVKKVAGLQLVAVRLALLVASAKGMVSRVAQQVGELLAEGF